jgi:hypothetical protein
VTNIDNAKINFTHYHFFVGLLLCIVGRNFGACTNLCFGKEIVYEYKMTNDFKCVGMTSF